LSGIQAKELYLECLQLLLRKQVYKLVSSRGFPAELETIVRDLWDLRIRGFNAVSSSRDRGMAQDDGNAQREESASSPREGIDRLAMYNTQTVDDTDGAIRGKGKSGIKIQDWICERSDDWKPPKVIETLAICWLGCVILRLPTRIGDILRMANAKLVPYISAVRELSSLTEGIID
jgi:RNA polymerase I-specific transcription initiation factor RRN7